jgi:trk system potassium uptake protein TrkH
MGGGAAVGAVWLVPLSDIASPLPPLAGRPVALRWSAWVAGAAWVGLAVGDLDESPEGAATIATCLAIALVHALAWLPLGLRAHPTRGRLLAATLLAAALLPLVLAGRPSALIPCLAAAAFLTLWITPGAGVVWATIVEHPARLLVATFFVLCVAGTPLLALPEASETGTSVGLLDAAFTSVSAVCVTGLIVVDTPNAFSLAGEAFILLLIQVGGLGIMTFYTAAISALGRRLSLRQESAIAGAVGVQDRAILASALRDVLRVTFVAEAAGALVLFAAFLRHGDGVGDALWRGVFTAISAFCNAGFALQTTSLMPYAGEPLILHTVAVLIVAGGLSPAVIVALPALARRRHVTLQVRLILATTAALLAVAFLAFLGFEWSNTLAGMPTLDRLHNAWFQSVTLRTAGFNSIDVGLTRPATQTMMIAMMFVGGSPGGTAGGVKTTTFAVLVLAVIAALRRRTDAQAFGRRVRHESVYKAAAVLTLGVVSAVAALVMVQLTQQMDVGVATFEVISALATVGLSTGGTGLLDGVGKILIMLCMFAGRVGPLTLFLFLTEHRAARPAGVPDEEVDVG